MNRSRVDSGMSLGEASRKSEVGAKVPVKEKIIAFVLVLLSSSLTVAVYILPTHDSANCKMDAKVWL